MDKDIINNIKILGIDMINEAKSGHPGIVLGAAPIIYTLYAKHINVNVNDPSWINRDRFIMSAGHGSALLYATLFMAGFSLTIDDLKKFRRLGSKTPGHPENFVTPGVDMTTGPLGQGFASAVGMAIAGKKLGQKFYFPKKSKLGRNRPLIDYNVYVLCGDGDLMEGISYEAASLAGSLKLDNLIVLYDSNNVSLDGETKNVFDENIGARFEAMGWCVEVVKDGESVVSIDKAITKAKENEKPTLIEITTIIGKDSMEQGKNITHGAPLAREDILAIKALYGMKDEDFVVNEEYRKNFSKMVSERGQKKFEDWNVTYIDYVKTIAEGDAKKMQLLTNNNNKINLFDLTFETDLKESPRDTNSKIIGEIGNRLPNFIGGAADLSSSTKTYLENKGDITSENFTNRNIKFGVREHAMGAIANGLSLVKYNPFVSTFLVFSDYLKPSIRMSALMNLPVYYIFTHDSINIGQDGSTHQPVEQLAMLRSIPNFTVFRPADAHEIVGSWQYMINNGGSSSIVLSRNEVPLLKTTDATLVEKGGYIVRQETKNIHGIIIATGSEVATAVYIANQLFEATHLDIRVVSMPCRELFKKQSKEYKDSILPRGAKTIVVEAGSKLGWEGFVYSDKYLITIDDFGISGTKDEVLTHMNFNYEQIKKRIEELLK